VPTYDYQCRTCGVITEVIHSMLDAGPSACDRCGGELRRVLYPTGIIFKGSGFYRNDSRATSEKSGASGADAAKPGSSAPGASSTAEAKPSSGGGGDGSSGGSSDAKATSSESA
jgi:putative FmdB family regulatory protein